MLKVVSRARDNFHASKRPTTVKDQVNTCVRVDAIHMLATASEAAHQCNKDTII
jgi:hypothetical protein